MSYMLMDVMTDDLVGILSDILTRFFLFLCSDTLGIFVCDS